MAPFRTGWHHCQKGAAPTSQAKREDQETEQPFEDVRGVQDEDVQLRLIRTRSTCLPVTTNKIWSSQEVSLVDIDPSVKLAQAYQRDIQFIHSYQDPERL
ncbi:hypothetical protein VZT92_007015 [Zoarces viviparus]|uniref:Uncharacterized protein n=1 Tax=Zoarces viviparus TaxID=48416 RepID=A0AAW1FIH0_ZOAVI